MCNSRCLFDVVAADSGAEIVGHRGRVLDIGLDDLLKEPSALVVQLPEFLEHCFVDDRYGFESC